MMERRKYPRVDLKFKVEYSQDDSCFAVGGRNLCPGGMAFVSRSYLPPGTWLHVKLKSEDCPIEIWARTRVVRCWKEREKIIAAAEFIEVHASDRDLLARVLKDFQHDYLIAASA